MTISEVAARMGLKPSAVRYYERRGILPAPERASGQRRYEESVFAKLAVIQRARRIGFTLDEIRQLFFGFKNGVPASARWQKLSRKKLMEIDDLLRETKAVKHQLEQIMKKCRCMTFEQCGRRIFKCDSGRPDNRRIKRMQKS